MKVAIVGTAGGFDRAPFGQPDWQVWGLNDLYRRFDLDDTTPMFAAWWELHGDTELTRARRPSGHFDRVKQMGIPVYYLHGAPPTPDAIRLNIDELAAQGCDYFACTNAYQIAEAMRLGATEIALYGTPLQTAREAIVERPCVSYWLGLAQGRGIKVSVDHDFKVGLMRHPFRYAAEDRDERAAAYWAVHSHACGVSAWLDTEASAMATGALCI